MWYSESDLLDYLKPQGVLHVKRLMRRVETQEKEWAAKPTNSVVITFAPNTERPENIDLGFTKHAVKEFVEPPPRCFRCQRFGHVAKVCIKDQRCKRCGGAHDYKACKADFACANCGGDHPASFGGCPFRVSALHRRVSFISGPKPQPTEKRIPGSDEFPALDSEVEFPALELDVRSVVTSNVRERPEPSKTAKSSVGESVVRSAAAKSVQVSQRPDSTARQPDKLHSQTRQHGGHSLASKEMKTPAEVAKTGSKSATFVEVVRQCVQQNKELKNQELSDLLRVLFEVLRSYVQVMQTGTLKNFLQLVLSFEPMITTFAATFTL